MSLCSHLKIDSEIGQKIEEITKRIGGTAKENQDITELCLLIDNKLAELEKVKKDAREAVNTSWRVVNHLPYKKVTELADYPLAGFIKSAKYHLSKIDYVFDEEEEDDGNDS